MRYIPLLLILMGAAALAMSLSGIVVMVLDPDFKTVINASRIGILGCFSIVSFKWADAAVLRRLNGRSS